MEVPAVDEGHVDGRATELASGVEPSESPPENEHAVSDDFRIAKGDQGLRSLDDRLARRGAAAGIMRSTRRAKE